MNLLIRNPWIVTMNDGYEIIRNGYVYVEGDKISEVGSDPLRMAQLSTQAGSIIDAADKILMPGMVSAHTHLFQTTTCPCTSGCPPRCGPSPSG